MKKMKLAAIFAGLVSVFTFSSCLNDGDSGPNYDLYEIVTVEDGSIFGAKVVRSVDPDLDKEALRVINSMPKWKPGMQKGEPVSVKFTVPIVFRNQLN